jgi:hypothetical protein
MSGIRHTPPTDSGGQLSRFLTPESMLTPGAAGGVTTLISNTLYSSFGLPPAHVGLLLSFVLGLLVLVAPRVWWERMIYYVLNSLIIFCVAFGAGRLAPPPASPGGKTSVGWLLLSPSYAQGTAPTEQATGTQTSQESPWQNPFGGPNSFFRCPFGGCTPRLTTEVNTDRRGGDYDNKDVPDLQSCQRLCLENDRCRAYTFVPPGYKHENWSGPTPRCWLKSVQPNATPWQGLTSGIRIH